jgi:antitoxin component of MazEF toxin-antitoxin module
MITELVKHGDEHAILIDPSLLDKINATAETAFELFSDGRSLVLVPHKAYTEAEIRKRYGPATRRLGE